MKLAIFSWELEIKITNRQPWEKDAASLVRRVDFEADAEYESGHYQGSLIVLRVKAFRRIAIDKGWNLSLKECKEWVERHFVEEKQSEYEAMPCCCYPHEPWCGHPLCQGYKT